MTLQPERFDRDRAVVLQMFFEPAHVMLLGDGQTEDQPLSGGALEARVAYDLIYNPEETRFLRDMRQAGAQVIGGLYMLVGQAARQFEWWTKRAANRDVMRDAARRFVREKSGS